MKKRENHKDPNSSVYDLTNGNVIVITTPPPVEEVSYSQGIVHKAVNALAELEQAREKIKADKTLSDLGRIEKLAPLRQQVERQIAEARAAIDEHATYVAAFEAKTFSPPELAKEDAVAMLQDMEIRQHLRSLGNKADVKDYEQVVSSPRLMEAVLRSPVSMAPYTQMIDRPWREHIERTHPDAKRLSGFKAAVKWAQGIISQLEQNVR
jgi:hypothetical protein